MLMMKPVGKPPFGKLKNYKIKVELREFCYDTRMWI
jgi:hypothetical protein